MILRKLLVLLLIGYFCFVSCSYLVVLACNLVLHPACGRLGKYSYANKTKDHALHGLLFCWIPAATYSPLGSQWSRCVGAEAHSYRSLAYRFSASLHPAQRALGSVMSQVKRCAQSDSGTVE